MGSVRVVYDTTAAATVQVITYDAWGNVASDTSPGFQPFGFAGGIYDKDTGLVRFGARDYDPRIGRWMTKDASRFAGGANFYAYAGDDPVNFNDATGASPSSAGERFVARLVYLLEKGEGGGLAYGRRLTFREAVEALINGENILADGGTTARDAARAAGNGVCPVHDTAHFQAAGPDARPHYHVAGRPMGSGHAFYSFFGFGPLLDLNGDGDANWDDAADLFSPWTPFFPEEYVPSERTAAY